MRQLPQTALLWLVAVLFAGACLPSSASSEQSAVPACVSCHASKQKGFAEGHAFAATGCTICHAGDGTSSNESDAHAGLLPVPGDLANARQTCGQCHTDRVDSVTHSLMHTGRGIVHTTRTVIDGHPGAAGTWNLQSLGQTVADSMLRKQCASCHVGQPKADRILDVTRDRGGGCTACHIGEYPDAAHPSLSADVSDGRCFGCHSRSGRISLSYYGLAEIDEGDLRLADGRRIQRLPADVHYDAGMRCTACHDADDVMSSPATAVHQRDAVDVACTDCHARHEGDTAHERLTCNACHSQWAPQCFGCHMEYDADGEQWDHVERRITAGRWSDQRWGARNTLPSLGVNAAGQIDVFVPGMIMTVSHPDWPDDLFVRRFAALSPHTTGKARSCASCHRSSTALGLGLGRIRLADGEIDFNPEGEIREDGLPADAWTTVTDGGDLSDVGSRPLNSAEMKAILGVEIPEP